MVQVLKEEIRSALLKYGFESFKEIGYRKTKISVIAKQAGITASTFYSYFESKNAFLMSIFEVWIIRIIEEHFEPLDECSTFNVERKMREFLYFSWIYIPKKDNFFIMNFVEAFLDLSAKELEKQNEFSMQDEEEFFGYYYELMDRVIGRNISRGLGHMVRHTTMGLLIEYQINEERTTQNAVEAIESYIEMFKALGVLDDNE